jgi:hypothetical protein
LTPNGIAGILDRMATPAWVRSARASLVIGLGGHAIANGLLDEDQFTRAGLAYTWAASIPLLVQTIAVIAFVAALGPLARRPGRLRRARPLPSHPMAAFGAFALTQMGLFLIFELSERVAQDEAFTAAGILGAGFTLELVFALAAAFVLTALATIAVRVVGAIRRAISPTTRDDHYGAFPLTVPRQRLLALAGGERAPPRL